MIIKFQNADLKILNSIAIASNIVTELEKQAINPIFKQKDYINKLYSKNKSEVRKILFNNPSLLFFLNSKAFDTENPFDEKQDDTADILVVKNGFYEVIDIKTRNLSKSAQAPNIISAFKLAQLCAIMIDNQEFDNLSINYFEVDWLLEKNKLVCKNAHYINLFKCIPENLYINWAAAMQLQFHVCNLDQKFKGTNKHWVKSYLKHFVAQVYRRSEYMVEKYAKPFEKYLD